MILLALGLWKYRLVGLLVLVALAALAALEVLVVLVDSRTRHPGRPEDSG